MAVADSALPPPLQNPADDQRATQDGGDQLQVVMGHDPLQESVVSGSAGLVAAVGQPSRECRPRSVGPLPVPPVDCAVGSDPGAEFSATGTWHRSGGPDRSTGPIRLEAPTRPDTQGHPRRCAAGIERRPEIPARWRRELAKWQPAGPLSPTRPAAGIECRPEMWSEPEARTLQRFRQMGRARVRQGQRTW